MTADADRPGAAENAGDGTALKILKFFLLVLAISVEIVLYCSVYRITQSAELEEAEK